MPELNNFKKKRTSNLTSEMPRHGTILLLISYLLLTAFLPSVVWAEDRELQFKRLSLSDGLPHTEVFSIAQDHQGFMYMGTLDGLARFDGERFINYTVKDGLPSNHVFMLHEDHRGILWVGTSNGLSQFSNGRFSNNLTTHDGLFSNTVFSMDTQQNETLWIGSFGGVSRIKM